MIISLVRKTLADNLSTDLTALIRAESNFYQKDKPITISEDYLINECLMFLSGLKSNLLFKQNNNKFIVNPKLRLIYLHKELEISLKEVIYYSQIVFKIENFIRKISQTHETQVYEALCQFLIEFLKSYKLSLNQTAYFLNEKVKKITLIDFLSIIRNEYFTFFDLLKLILDEIEFNEDKISCEKSLNIIILVHKKLIDSFSVNNLVKKEHKFLLLLFSRLLTPYLKFIDTLIQEGILNDYKNELGFMRQTQVSINSIDYWKNGYKILYNTEREQPLFIKIILSSSFKICKQMEIINKLENLNSKSNIYESFMTKLRNSLPYFKISNYENQNIDLENTNNLLEHNFRNLILNKSYRDELKIFNNPFTDEILGQNIDFNLEELIETILNECYYELVSLSSVNLLENLFKKYHMFDLFKFIHSYYLFISNEIVYLFSERLFNLIKRYETYQDDTILNTLFYNSANSIFQNDADNYFNFNCVSLQYDLNSKAETSKLISSIKLRINVKWPLNIIVTKADFEIYNQIFLFLLQIKQVKNDLERLEKTDLDLEIFSKKKVPKSSLLIKYDEASVRRMYLIRMKFLNFINNAHNLIGDQIFEMSNQFLEKIKTQSDIDEILDLHSKFLNLLVKNCLLKNKFFQSSLQEIFILILEFCDTWRKGLQYFATEQAQEFVEKIDNSIKNHFQFLYTILSAYINKNHSTYFQTLIAVL